VVRALENPGPDPTYLEFFGFERPPFARLSRPSQVFHTEQYSLLTAHLAVATEQSDCLVVICGADGSGKTTLLNRYITGLSDEISFATIDETCNGEKQFYLAFLRQLGFKDITGKARELRRITEEFLVNRGMAGDPVLMMIDNAHLVKPTVLEQLRRVSAIKAKNRRVLSVVLAGNSDLVGIMDSPAMSQIKFRSHVLFNIRVYTEEETTSYVWHHLRLAGGTEIVNFSTEAQALIYRYTGGVPNLINVLCNDVLTEACTLKSRDITEDLVRTVADKRRLSPHVVPRQGTGRRSTDPDFKLARSERQAGERITARDSTAGKPAEKSTPKLELPDVDGKKLLDQIAELSERVGAIKADRERTLEDIGTREKDLSGLRKKLAAVTTETEKLTVTLGSNTAEIGRLNQELSDSTKALEKSEKASKKLAADLKKEKSAAKSAQTDIAKSKATVEELTQQKSELQTTVSKLTTDLKLAEEQVAEISVLEKSNAALKEEIEKHAGQLDSKDEDIGELEKMLQESQNECASLRVRVATLNNLEKSVSEADARIADLKADLASYNQGIEALEAENGEPESRDVEPAQAEDISTLESDPDPDEDDPTLTGNRSKVAEEPDLTAPPKIKEREPPKIRQQPDLDETASTPGPAGKQSDAVITAFEVFNKDGKIEQVMELAEGQSRIMIGRSEDSELRLNSAFVSRHHALIFCTEQGVYIENLNSFNGTLVNSEKITRHDLRVGDVVTIGDFEIRPRQA
jgi:type II secretory pathway predicted ATPase ExeA/septal ring factor EnvC (AmiA/AmiB activator)